MNNASHSAALVLLAIGIAAGCSHTDNAVRADDDLRSDAAADASTVIDSSSPTTNGTPSFVDTRDGKSYPTIKFGSKTWLAKNLDFVIAGSSFCYDDAPSNCATDGRLYPWSVARTACPPGSHLGSDDEWKALETAIGMRADQLNLEGYATPRGTNEGTKLKTPTDGAGFGARMAGFRTDATYEARGDRTYFWTATMRGPDVWRRRVAAAEATVFRFTNPPSTFAISVRCVLD